MLTSTSVKCDGCNSHYCGYSRHLNKIVVKKPKLSDILFLIKLTIFPRTELTGYATYKSPNTAMKKVVKETLL